MAQKVTYAEQIIKKVKQAQDPEQLDYLNIDNNIHDGYVIVQYQKLELEERVLVDEKITMCLPKDFQLMKPELVDIKYPGEDQPEFVYTNEKTTVNMTFSLEKEHISNEAIESLRDALAEQMQQLYPDSPIADQEIIEAGRKRVACFSFEVPLLDEPAYNVMFFMALKEGLLIGSFNCSVYDKKEWRPIVKQLLTTIRENTLEKIE